MRTVRLSLLLAGVSLALLAFLYGVALGTARGLSFDGTAIVDRVDQAAIPRVHDLSASLIHTIDVTSIALVGTGILVLALVRRRPDQAAAAAAAVFGAGVTTQVLKPLLGGLDPLGGEVLRGYRGTFPSGHATFAMSLGLAVVLASPEAARGLAAVAGAAYAIAVGVGLVALGWHYPSDVVGGYLVAGAWAGLVSSWLNAHPSRRKDRPRGERKPALVPVAGAVAFLALAAAFATVLALSLYRHPEALSHGPLDGAFFAAAAGLAAVALVLFVVVSLLRPAAPSAPATEVTSRGVGPARLEAVREVSGIEPE